jgi:ATP-binding cassette subfamily B protein
VRFAMFKKFASYYRNHMGLFILDMTCALIIAGIDLIFPSALKIIIDDYIKNNLLNKIYVLGAILLGAYILRAILSFVLGYWGHMMGARIERDMRRDLFRKYQELDFQFFDDNKTGVLMSNLTTHLHDISEMSHHVPEDAFISAVLFFGSFVFLMFINPHLTLIIFAFVIIQLVFAFTRRIRMLASFRTVRTTQGELNSQIESSIEGIRLTKAYNNEDFEVNKFGVINKDYERSWNDAYLQLGIFNAGNEFFAEITNLALLIIGGIFVFKKEIEYTDFIQFFFYINLLTRPINRLLQMMQQTQQGISGFEKFYNIINITPAIVSKPEALKLNEPKGDIRFVNASFAYEAGREDILKDFNLHIKPGQKIGLIGETGVGKSTISKLIPRFYELNSGQLLIDEIDVKDYDVQSLRNAIGHVQQDVFIFYGTIMDNILFGRPEATMDEVIQAAKQANIHEFIMSLEKGYDTVTGERGVKLSGGQQQRIAIARLFLKNPSILILDEATSSLDNATEHMVQEAFDLLAKNKTAIIIAHRLTTIRDCDLIVVLGRNGIIEMGSHDQLIALNGTYKKLLQQ